MKIILSRKGFDSGYGGQASPILPDGTMLSLPIPDDNDRANTYSSLSCKVPWKGAEERMTLDEIIHHLNPRNRLKGESNCHLDPDLYPDIRPRESGWKQAFGQMNASLTHLRNQGVGIGDLFLFFGWFKRTEWVNGQLRYVKGAPDIHAIYGYMQIGRIIDKKEDVPAWLKEHPHECYDTAWGKHLNCLFLPSARLSILPEMQGAGTLPFDDKRVLTKEGRTKSRWDLPECFRTANISYHSAKSWKNSYFQSAAKGQEFVVDASPEIIEWCRETLW